MRSPPAQTPVATIQSPGRMCGRSPPAMPKLTIAGAPENTACRIAAARNPTFPPHAKTLTPGADAIRASARIPVMTINQTPSRSFSLINAICSKAQYHPGA